MFNISALLGDHWHSSSSLAAAKTERTTATVVQWSLKPIIQTILFSSTRKLAWKSCGCRSVSRNQVANNQLKPCHTDYPTCEKKRRKQNTNFQHSGPNPPKRVKEKPDRKKWNFSVPALEMPTSQSGSASGWWIFTTVSEQYPWRKLEVAVLPETFNVAEGPRLQTFKGKILRMWTRKGSLTSAP